MKTVDGNMVREGYGIFLYKDGDKYEGYYKEGERYY